MNSLIPNFAARLAASAPVTPPPPATTASAAGASQNRAAAAFSAHMAAEHAQSTPSADRHADAGAPSKGPAADSGGKRARKAADGEPSPADGKTLPVALPTAPVSAPSLAAAPAPAIAAAVVAGVGGGTDADGDDSDVAAAEVTAAGPTGAAPQAHEYLPGPGLQGAARPQATSGAAQLAATALGAAQGAATAAGSTLATTSTADLPGAPATANAAQPTTARDADLRASAVVPTPNAPGAPGGPPIPSVTIKMTRATAPPIAPRIVGAKAVSASTAQAQDLPPASATDPVTAGNVAPTPLDGLAGAQTPAAEATKLAVADSDPSVASVGAPGASAATDPALLVPLLGPSGVTVHAAGVPALPSAPAVQVPVGSPEWGQAVGESVKWAANQNLTHAQISLNPDHLGPLEIRLSLVGGEASVAFSTHSHAAAQALHASSAQLRTMLGQAGFAQVNVDISQQSGRQPAFSGSAYREQPPPAAADTSTAAAVVPRVRSSAALDAYA